MSEATFFIKPHADLIVRDPMTREPLAADGEEKPRSKYWLSREIDGSVIQAVKPAAKPAPEQSAPKKEGDKK